MIRMRVGDQYSVETRQITQRNTWRAYPGQKPAKMRIEVGVGKKDTIPDFN